MAMHIKVEAQSEGLHPKETVVTINTKDGLQSLVVDKTLVENCGLFIDWPIDEKDGYTLVELPQETFRGYRRVWVKNDAVFVKADRACA